MKQILLILATCLSFSAPAQLDHDSLLYDWNNVELPDDRRFKSYLDLIWEHYVFPHPDTAYVMADNLLKLALQKDNKRYQGEAYNTKAMVLVNRGEYAESLELNNQGVKIGEQTRDTILIGKCVGDMGIVYYQQEKFALALRLFLKALELNEASGYLKGLTFNYGNIGNVYNSLEDYGKAETYYLKAMELNETLGDKQALAAGTSNLGNVYLDQGDTAKSVEYRLRGIQLSIEGGFMGFELIGYLNLASTYNDIGELDKAAEFLEKADSLAPLVGAPFFISAVKALSGINKVRRGKYSEGIELCEISLAEFRELKNIEIQIEACQCLIDAHKALGDGIKALEYHELLLALRDSSKFEKNKRDIQKIEFKKQWGADSLAQIEEDRIKELAHQEEVRQKNRTRNILLGSGLLLLVFAGGLWSRLRFIRRSKAVLQIEKDRSESLLLNILPEKVAEELKSTGESAAKEFGDVTVLFTDFQGFTDLSSNLSAAELVSEINHCFKAFDSIVEKRGLEKIKTIGDAYMAAGGLHEPRTSEPRDVVLAGIEMQQFIAQRQAEQTSKNLPFFKMRVGIHTGPVVAGIVGVKKFQYDIWGDTVNTASRMESSGEVGKVNISQSTYELIKDDPEFAFESRGKIQAKGKGEIEMWFVSRRNEA